MRYNQYDGAISLVPGSVFVKMNSKVTIIKWFHPMIVDLKMSTQIKWIKRRSAGRKLDLSIVRHLSGRSQKAPIGLQSLCFKVSIMSQFTKHALLLLTYNKNKETPTKKKEQKGKL